MLAWLMTAMMAGQDAGSLRIRPPPVATGSIPWSQPVACAAPAPARAVAFDALPAEVLVSLRTIDRRMSPPGGPFNATDVIVDDTPQTRMIAALRRGDRIAVAYERGGRGYGVTVVTFDLQRSTGLFALRGVGPLSPAELTGAPRGDEPACRALVQALESAPPR